MLGRRRRRARPADALTMPLPQAAPRVTALEYYSARLMPDYSGWWVYALGARTDGHIFYSGQTDNLISRLRDHSYQHKDLFDPARVYLIPVEHQGRADVVELELIDFYQPERNTVGREADLRGRARRLNKPDVAGWNAGLDRKQATS